MNDNFENKNFQNLNHFGTQNNAQNGTQSNYQNNAQSGTNQQNQKVKLRLRLKSGEEFEAEGALSFVLAQKNEFLTNTNPTFKPKTAPIPAYLPENNTLPQQQAENSDIPEISANNTTPDSAQNPQNFQNTMPIQQPETTEYTTQRLVKPEEYNLHIPAIRRRKTQNPQQEMLPLGDNNSATTATDNFTANTSAITQQPLESKWQIDEKIWSKIAYLDGTDIVLRRKIKDLKPNLAALIILAAAKMLAGITKMSALELSKSLRLSGYMKGGERLDRIIAPEIKAGTLFFEGSKRNRWYIISHTGTAKAYTAAEHFLR